MALALALTALILTGSALGYIVLMPYVAWEQDLNERRERRLAEEKRYRAAVAEFYAICDRAGL